MNGIRTLVLQDLSHILPPRGRQLHATASSRRFWNFFEFSLKEDASSRGPKKCASSKDISSSLIATNELESVSRNHACSSASRAISPNLNPKIHVYHFDLKANSVGSPKAPSPLSQPDNLVSLLDGNPVPKTMKWKLKGYKTLRNEESSDFAFVPGGNSYDLDILSRNCPKPKNDGNRDTLCLTTRAIENKPNVDSGKSVKPNVKAEVGSSNEQNVATVETLETVQTPGMTAGITKKEDQFLLISKSESVASNLQCQSQPKVQYSSKPPKSISKPLPPGMNKELVDNSRPSIDKPMSALSAESYQQVSKSPTESLPQEDSGHVASEWSSMEQRAHVTEQKMADSKQGSQVPSRLSNNRVQEVEEPSASVAQPKYYAPRQWRYSKSNLPDFDDKSAYESILSVLPKHIPLKISSPQNHPVKTSPCAATQARLQQASKELRAGFQNESQGQTGSSGFGGSMTGGSGGSRKPPAFYPPITMKRSSSNAPCLTKNAAEKEPRKSVNKNSSSNISTSSADLAPRKCDDHGEMEEGRTVCTKPRQRKCGKQRKESKKVCKRYCCPALQVSTECDFSKYSKNKEGKKPRVERDPTCLPNEEEGQLEGGREICTRPRRRDQSCKRERSCSRERRRSCNREESCPRNRNRSCKRQERRDCSQNREEQGREICTKPRKRESCNRQKCSDRDCGRRSAKCTGRRNFTHSAFAGRRKPMSNMRRYSSLPAFAFSLIGMKSSGETKQNVFSAPVNGRFFGKKPPPCKPPKSDEKCQKPASNTDVKCKTPPAKCKPAKKTERICKPVQKTESTCKPAKKTENICKPPKRTESTCKPPPRTEDKCKPPKRTESTCKPAKKEPKCKTQPKCAVKRSDTICQPPKKTDDICKPPKKTDDICKPPKKTESICKPPKKTESICKPPKKTESICKPPKKTESICKPPKKTEDICKPPKKTEDICKPPKKTESTCKPPKKTESKCKVTKKSDPCKVKSKSDDYCAKKREQICKERKSAQPSTSQGESLKERLEREKKEMEECKKHIKRSKKDKDKKKEEKVPKGLERVVSPCKQSGKCGKDPSKKMSCIGVPFDCLVSNTVGNVITMSDNKPFSILPDRNYSVMRSSSNFDQFEPWDAKSEENMFWNNYEDDFGTDAVPVPIETENEDEKFNDSRYSNWFLSWFNNDQR